MSLSQFMSGFLGCKGEDLAALLFYLSNRRKFRPVSSSNTDLTRKSKAV